ncbi:MAG: hypothetical protein J7455_19500 [Roseiflexus sp.]|nr:hypothetical protein [Roseiflexus sp.]MBO9382072.1 hypothetical protein [Roseiflexus sp.]MBO9388727.1 hypothetical protein [Roseiflexus sp.]
MPGHGPRTSTNLFRTIVGTGSVASLSHFLTGAPWSQTRFGQGGPGALCGGWSSGLPAPQL